MKLRTALGGIGATLGVTYLANRSLARRAIDFEPILDGDQGTYRWRGFDVAYTELGDPEDDDVILFHGLSAASSNHEFLTVADRLAESYHVIAPDLPGFGHSDRPPLLYSASLYTTFIGDAIEELTDDPPTVVGSSLAGAFAAEAAREVDVEQLILVTPTATTTEERRGWLRSLLRAPLVGTGAFNLLVSKGAIQYFHEEHGLYDVSKLTEEMLDYEWTTAHQPGARFAPASFLSGHLDAATPLEESISELEVPVTLVWGRNATKPPLTKGRKLAERSNVGLIVFDRAKMLPHVEHPDRFVDVVDEGVSVEQ